MVGRVDMAPICRAGIRYDDLIRNVTIKPGQTVRVGINREGDIEERKRKKNIVTATVLRIYKHHVLLDLGKYKECRRKADLYFGLC